MSVDNINITQSYPEQFQINNNKKRNISGGGKLNNSVLIDNQKRKEELNTSTRNKLLNDIE